MDAVTETAPDQSETPDPRVQHDLKTLAAFIELYCTHHQHELRQTVSLRTHDLRRIAGRNIALCPQCTRLLSHAFVKRSHCPMNPKPACKHCPAHCYHPRYRQAIAEVMPFSGRRMVMGGRLDYLVHLLF